MKILVSILAVGLALAGCKRKAGDGASGGGKLASCNLPGVGECEQYNEDNLAIGSASLAKLCTVVDKKAAFTMTACPTADVVGTCTTPEAKHYYYKSNASSAEQLEKYCTTGIPAGTFENH
jgi:hypothetical protein